MSTFAKLCLAEPSDEIAKVFIIKLRNVVGCNIEKFHGSGFGELLADVEYLLFNTSYIGRILLIIAISFGEQAVNLANRSVAAPVSVDIRKSSRIQTMLAKFRGPPGGKP